MSKRPQYRTVAKLTKNVKKLQGKLADPKDKDDKRWVKRWLTRTEKSLARRQRGLELKLRERQTPTRRRPP